MKMKGSQALIQSLVDHGVDIIFGIPGGVAIPIYDALYDAKGLRNLLVEASVQKVFPAAPPAQLGSYLGPLPFLRLLPTSGVDADNVAAYLQAGCFAVGFVSSLFVEAEIAAGRIDRIEARARRLVAAVRAAS